MRRFSILHFMNIKLAVYIVVTLCLVNVATTTVMKSMTLAIAQGSQNQTHYQTTSNNKAPIVSLLANNLANRLNKSGGNIRNNKQIAGSKKSCIRVFS